MRTRRLLAPIVLVLLAMPCAFADLFTSFSVDVEAEDHNGNIFFSGGCDASGGSSAICAILNLAQPGMPQTGTVEGVTRYGSLSGDGGTPVGPPFGPVSDINTNAAFSLDTGFTDDLTIYGKGGNGYLALVIPAVIDDNTVNNPFTAGNLSVTVGNETTNTAIPGCPDCGAFTGPVTLLFPITFNAITPFDLELTYFNPSFTQLITVGMDYSANIGAMTVLDSNLNQLSDFQYRTESHSPYPINGGVLVPEPSAIVLLGSALLILGILGSRWNIHQRATTSEN